MNFDSRAWTKGQTKDMVIGVFGSRTLKDERVEIILTEKCRELNTTKIVTCQEPEGVSEVAQKVAKRYAYPLQLHFLNMQYLRGAFEQRSIEIIKACDYFVIIHDGVSKGTQNEYELVKKLKKPHHYEVLEKTEFKRSVGFNITDDWDADINKWGD